MFKYQSVARFYSFHIHHMPYARYNNLFCTYDTFGKYVCNVMKVRKIFFANHDERRGFNFVQPLMGTSIFGILEIVVKPMPASIVSNYGL